MDTSIRSAHRKRRLRKGGVTHPVTCEKESEPAPSALSRIISGEQNLTLATIAKLEYALDVRFDAEFRYETEWKGLSYSKPQEQVEIDKFSDDQDECFSSRRMDENAEAPAYQAVERNDSMMGVAA